MNNKYIVTIMVNIIVCIVIIICIIIYIIPLLFNKNVETYYDITPYERHWDIFSCYNNKCTRDNAFKCFKWCDIYTKMNEKEGCRKNCADYADQYYVSLKYNNYNFNNALPHLKKYSLLNE